MTRPSRATVILLAACTVLLVGVAATGLALSAQVNSLTVDDVTAEVVSGMDGVQSQLSEADVVSASTTTRSEPCPTGAGGELISVERTIQTVDAFDTAAWAQRISAKYAETDGWTATLVPNGSSASVTLTLVNRALMIYTLKSGTQTLVMQATSRCSTI